MVTGVGRASGRENCHRPITELYANGRGVAEWATSFQINYALSFSCKRHALQLSSVQALNFALIAIHFQDE